LLKASGCIAVSGGLEVASDRLLKLIKGVTVEQVAKVLRNFKRYGSCVFDVWLSYTNHSGNGGQSGNGNYLKLVYCNRIWHQFAMTAHSPVGLYRKFGVVKETEAMELS
jgi:hypothetical protein